MPSSESQIHLLLLVGCYLNLLLQSFEFASDIKVRSEMRQNAEDLTRQLTRPFLNDLIPMMLTMGSLFKSMKNHQGISSFRCQIGQVSVSKIHL